MTDPTLPLTLPVHCEAATLAHAYLDSAPEGALSVDEYEWQIRPLGLGEMEAACPAPWDGVDPSQSSQVPVVVSFGDGERTPIQVWDGFHRLWSSLKTGKGGRPAAVGVRREGKLYLDDLSEDLYELVSCIFEDAEVDIPETVPTRAVRVDRFPDVALATGNDHRGVAHAADMAGQYLPPVVMNGDVWMDGRHRIHHLKEAGVEWMLAIDLAGLVPAPRPGDCLHIGVLLPASHRDLALPPTPDNPSTTPHGHSPKKLTMTQNPNADRPQQGDQAAVTSPTKDQVINGDPWIAPSQGALIDISLVLKRTPQELKSAAAAHAHAARDAERQNIAFFFSNAPDENINEALRKMTRNMEAPYLEAALQAGLFQIHQVARPTESHRETADRTAKAWTARIEAVSDVDKDLASNATPAFLRAFEEVANEVSKALRSASWRVMTDVELRVAAVRFSRAAHALGLNDSGLQVSEALSDGLQSRQSPAQAMEKKAAALQAIDDLAKPKERFTP